MEAALLRRALALLVSAALSASLLVALVGAPAAAASPTACRVKNLDTGVTKRNLQKAVRAARKGHRLTVRGTCHGTTSIGKRLIASVDSIEPRFRVMLYPHRDGDRLPTTTWNQDRTELEVGSAEESRRLQFLTHTNDGTRVRSN